MEVGVTILIILKVLMTFAALEDLVLVLDRDLVLVLEPLGP